MTDAAPERATARGVDPSERRGSKRRHRIAVWSLIVLASVVLVISIIASWVQRQVMDPNQFRDTTDQILKDAAGARDLHSRSALRER